jgi:hypothetical protein
MNKERSEVERRVRPKVRVLMSATGLVGQAEGLVDRYNNSIEELLERANSEVDVESTLTLDDFMKMRRNATKFRDRLYELIDNTRSHLSAIEGEIWELKYIANTRGTL